MSRENTNVKAYLSNFNCDKCSDHNTIAGGLAAEKLALAEYNSSIVVIPGMEYTCCRIHMNFIDINETIPTTGPFPSDEDLQKAINRVHELGGLVIVNHIPWSNTTRKCRHITKIHTNELANFYV